MKKTVLNGQVLSEKEMKEVKGGHEFTSPGGAIVCPVCEYWSLENLGNDKYKCKACGSIIDKQ